MRLNTILRYGAYPVILGGIATFVLIWATLGGAPWPPCS